MKGSKQAIKSFKPQNIYSLSSCGSSKNQNKKLNNFKGKWLSMYKAVEPDDLIW